MNIAIDHTTTQRYPAIDMAKALGIALVVMGHISGRGEGQLLIGIKSFIYCFHVPLFFFLSGYCFKENQEWTSFLVKKIKNLYFPFLFSNLFFMVISSIAHYANGERVIIVDTLKHAIKLILGIAVTPLGGATWFLITLLQSLILYKLLVTISNYWRLQKAFLLMSTILMAVAGTLVELPWGMEKMFIAVFFICVGHLTKSSGFVNRLGDSFYLPIAFIGFILVLISSRYNQPDMAFHWYGIIPIYFVSALIGTYSVLLLCHSLLPTRMESIRSDWGRRSLWILIGHFTAFKVVILAQICISNDTWDALFSHPCYNVEGVWSLLYFIFGYFLPLIICGLWRRSRS